MKQVIVTVSPDGTPTVTAAGYSGGECLLKSHNLIEKLGGADNQNMTDAYYANNTEGISQEN